MADAQRTPEPGTFTPSCFNNPRHETSHYFLLSARSLGVTSPPAQFSSLAPVGLLRPTQPCCVLGVPIAPGWAQLSGLPHRHLSKERPSAPNPNLPRLVYSHPIWAYGRHRQKSSSALGGTQDHNAAPQRRASLPPAPPAPWPRSPQPSRNRAPLTSDPPPPNSPLLSPQSRHAARPAVPSPAPFPCRLTLAVPAARRGRHVGRRAPLCAQSGESREPPPPPANGLRAGRADTPHRLPPRLVRSKRASCWGSLKGTEQRGGCAAQRSRGGPRSGEG